MLLLSNCMFPVNFILDEHEYYVQLCALNDTVFKIVGLQQNALAELQFSFQYGSNNWNTNI